MSGALENCDELPSDTLATYIGRIYDSVEEGILSTKSVIVVIPQVRNIRVEVLNRTPTRGSHYELEEAAQTWPDIELILVTTRSTSNEQLVARFQEHLEVYRIDDIDQELVVCDDEVYIEEGILCDECIEGTQRTHFCIHSYPTAKDLIQSMFGISP